MRGNLGVDYREREGCLFCVKREVDGVLVNIISKYVV